MLLMQRVFIKSIWLAELIHITPDYCSCLWLIRGDGQLSKKAKWALLRKGQNEIISIVKTSN